MALNIWFNRWFSTVSHYIDMIRNNPDQQEFVIYGTNSDLDAVYLKSCDIAGTEPEVEGKEYLNFCLDFCKKNKIDIFIPRKENVLISQHIEDFKKIGVMVLVCSDGELMALMDDKAAMYRALEEKELEGKSIVTIPAYHIVNNAEDFKSACLELTSKGYKVCMKPVVGEGSCGFRIIDDTVDSIPFLFSKAITQRMSFETVYRVLQQQEHFPDLMIMEYLEGVEYSIDCLADEQGNLLTAIPRKKGKGRVRVLEDNKELLTIAEKFAKGYKIPFVYNIQVKYQNGIPKLLEVNPRMSGGLHISCLSGINIPYYAIKVLLEGKIEPLHPDYGIKATHIEQPVILTNLKQPQNKGI